jgi:type I restriction enzyme S subunit
MKPVWKVKKINDIATVVNGGTPDTNRKDFWGGNILWITPKDMGKLSSIYVDDTERKITEAGLKNSSAKMIPPNSIILSSRAPIGHLAINNFEISTNQGCKGIIPKKEILTKYLYYFLRNSIELLNSLGTGTTFKELSSTKLNDVEVPIPPLPEQQHIVGILDQSFAAIDQAIENTAINKEYSKEIYEAFIDNIFDSLIKICPTKKLNEISIIRPPKNEAKEKLNVSSMVSFAPMEDLGINQKYMIPEKEKKLIDVYGGYTYFAENDVLLAKITPCFENGKLGIAKELMNSIGFGSSEYIVFRPFDRLRSEFLYYFLSREKFRNEGVKHMQGAVGHKRVSLDFVSNYLIPIPSLEQQDEIIDKIDIFFDQTNSLRSNYENKIDLYQELKQSILHKAFNRDLT